MFAHQPTVNDIHISLTLSNDGPGRDPSIQLFKGRLKYSCCTEIQSFISLKFDVVASQDSFPFVLSPYKMLYSIFVGTTGLNNCGLTVEMNTLSKSLNRKLLMAEIGMEI